MSGVSSPSAQSDRSGEGRPSVDVLCVHRRALHQERLQRGRGDGGGAPGVARLQCRPGDHQARHCRRCSGLSTHAPFAMSKSATSMQRGVAALVPRIHFSSITQKAPQSLLRASVEGLEEAGAPCMEWAGGPTKGLRWRELVQGTERCKKLLHLGQ
ncbi:Protein of unknown function [Gryllus bimaculatus]|nr:Protein of unknown function [Gryllus bimaculatus]